MQGAQAEGLEVVLVNSNPATIMTDPEIADRTYVEPLTPEVLGQDHRARAARRAAADRRRADGAEPRGRARRGRHAREVRRRADRRLGRRDQGGRGSAAVPRRDARDRRRRAREPLRAARWTEAIAAVDDIGFPIIIRPSFTLGGVGGGIAYNIEEFREIAGRGLELSPVHEVLLEESVIGWKEFELEVMRDSADNFVVICSIENVDPMGVHTGDSITVAPALTLTDREYQRMRDLGRRIIRRVGVETGGSNIQFAINPENGRIIVIEMNPRVSRSSALASKATGFPIAKIAAKLALGYHLDEIPNDITRLTPGVVRADHRLRRRQGAALGVREVPARRPDADHADEVGRRGDGDRPDLQGSVHEGVPLARARVERPAVRPATQRRRPTV